MILGRMSCRFDRMDIVAIALIVLVCVAMSLVVNPVGDFPLNDDWIYGGAVRSLLSGNGFRIPGPTIANVLSQAIWGAAFCAPFGFSYTALRVSTLVLSLTGLLFFYALMYENGLGRRMAVVATLALAVNSLYFLLAESFMTDVPFVALMIVSLYFLTRSLRDNSTNCLLAGVVVLFAAILTRQIGVAPLLAYAVANALKSRFRSGPSVLGIMPLISGAGLHLAYQHWLTTSGRGPEIHVAGIGELVPRTLGLFASTSIHFTAYVLPYVGFAVLPVVAISGLLPLTIQGTRASRLVFPCLGMAGAAALMLLWRKGELIPFLGNVILGIRSGSSYTARYIPAEAKSAARLGLDNLLLAHYHGGRHSRHRGSDRCRRQGRADTPGASVPRANQPRRLAVDDDCRHRRGILGGDPFVGYQVMAISSIVISCRCCPSR